MTNLDQFATAKTASVDALFGLAGQAFEGVEKLTALNLQAIKTSLAESAEATQSALSAKTPQDLFTLQSTLTKSGPEKAIAYGRQVKEILTDATAQQRAQFEAQFSDVQAKFLEAVNAVLKNAPGAENTLSLVKSAVAAANNAYEGVNKASKQVTEAVDANITKFTETAAKTSRAKNDA